jgi:catechol 2,3-dioxygenase-like lactoylglutathione lyase family enzyme
MKAPAIIAILCLGLGATPLPPDVDRSALQVSGAFFAVSVSDLTASIAWYTEKLGLRVTKEIPDARVAILEGNDLIVELTQDASPGAQPTTMGVPGGMAVRGITRAGFIVADFDNVLARLRAPQAEIAFGPYPARPGQPANVIIKDNGGNLVQIFGK